MEEIYKPTKYYQNIYEINYQLLKEENISVILFDLDNTIAKVKDKEPSQETIELFNKLRELGFKIYIFSNALPHRVKKFASILGTDKICFACKPLKRNYLKLLNQYSNKEIVAIGDQIYTDIKGANRHNIKSILGDRISKIESIFKKFNRLKERRLIDNKKIIVRGEYYE